MAEILGDRDGSRDGRRGSLPNSALENVHFSAFLVENLLHIRSLLTKCNNIPTFQPWWNCVAFVQTLYGVTKLNLAVLTLPLQNFLLGDPPALVHYPGPPL